MELRKQREVREVTYVEAGLHRMHAVRPRQVVYVLVAILIRTLRATERRANIEVCPLLAGLFALVRCRAQETVPEEPGFVDYVCRRCRGQRDIERVIVDD